MFYNIDKHPASSLAAVDDSGYAITYGELANVSRTIFAGVPSRSLIFILAENSIGSLAGYMASLSDGIVPLLVNATIDIELLSNLIEQYRPSFLWLPAGRKDLSQYPIVHSSLGYCLMKTGITSPDLYRELSILLPTSGSTGSPKLVRHSYQNLEFSASSVSSFFGIDANERALAILPMYYTMGLSVINSHIFSGATVLLSKRSLTDREFWSFVKENKATSFTGVPYSYEVLEKIRFRRMQLPDLRTLAQGGGKLSEVLFREYANFAGSTGRRFFATYGQTEGTARMAFLPPEMAESKVCSIGGAIPGGRLELVDNSGSLIESKEGVGEMVYYGQNVTLGYALCADDLSKGDDNGGTLRTGDIARRDADGCYYIIGRNSRFLKLHGSRISLDEVEQIVRSHIDTDCYCSGNDNVLQVNVTNESAMNAVRDLIIEKTGIFIKALEVIHTPVIRRNESGKILY